MAKVTPMMQQYLELKEKHKDCILFFRLGDFYEMFFEDALTASKALEITLTGRDCGLEERAPMCGVPFHSAEGYVHKLVSKGFKVAICEQVEDPATAKGIVKRDVVKIITSGTVTNPEMLDDKKSNYLMSVFEYKGYFGVSVVDITTGDFQATQIILTNAKDRLKDEVAKFSPSEIISNIDISDIENRIELTLVTDEKYDIEKLKKHIQNDVIFEEENSLAFSSALQLVHYILNTQKTSLSHIKKLYFYSIDKYMTIDSFTRRNLELTETMLTKKRRGSLLDIIDKTMTSMGSRKIKSFVEQPLVEVDEINARLDAVDELKDKFMIREEIRESLKGVYDIERLMGKIVLGNVNSRDLLSFKNSLGRTPEIKRVYSDTVSGLNKYIENEIDSLEDLHSLIEASIHEDPPVTIKEGNIIKDGYDSEVDKLREAKNNGRSWIAKIETDEKEKTGIKNLKIGYNKVFGYYLEVTPSYYSLIPDHYIRKQTLSNCERFITEELKEVEYVVLGAEQKVCDLEYKIFNEIKEKIVAEVDRVKETAEALSYLDVLTSFAELADRESYCRPIVDDSDSVDITDGRHPVVERMLEGESFVPNNTLLNLDDDRLSIITGPNMAGKSTYLRQVALITLLAQIGCFVPALSAHIGVVDRIFTRVGASDDLAAGQSTFMVEMSELASILKNARRKSLIILDEIGRGTSTFDGLSIAWSVVEYICDKKTLGARTLFATHYHEITELEGKISGVKNYCIDVEEKGDDIIFLRKIIRGGADGSYGIQVAKLAGLPNGIISRSKEILSELEDADIIKKEKKLKKKSMGIEGQVSLFNDNGGSNEIIDEIKDIDVGNLTPMDALNMIDKLQKKLEK